MRKFLMCLTLMISVQGGIAMEEFKFLSDDETMFLYKLNFYSKALDVKLSLDEQAYIMATVWHETGHTFESEKEEGGEVQRYKPYYGRGYIQLTHRDNYVRIGKYLYNLGYLHEPGLLRDFPDLALDEHLAMIILIKGMTRKWFTGVALGQYFNDNFADPMGARAVVNGSDKAKLIADKYDYYLEVIDEQRR